MTSNLQKSSCFHPLFFCYPPAAYRALKLRIPSCPPFALRRRDVYLPTHNMELWCGTEGMVSITDPGRKTKEIKLRGTGGGFSCQKTAGQKEMNRTRGMKVTRGDDCPFLKSRAFPTTLLRCATLGSGYSRCHTKLPSSEMVSRISHFYTTM